jgi:hypothetical protein
MQKMYILHVKDIYLSVKRCISFGGFIRRKESKAAIESEDYSTISVGNIPAHFLAFTQILNTSPNSHRSLVSYTF